MKWGKSKWCQKPGTNHQWCMNRNATETHCTCPCHQWRSDITTYDRDIDALRRRIADRGLKLKKLTGLYR